MATATLIRTPTTTLVADVFSGDAHPVAGIAVDVDYRYPHGASRRTRAVTDGDGRAVLVDDHPAPPTAIAVSVAGQAEVVTPTAEMRVVVEL